MTDHIAEASALTPANGFDLRGLIQDRRAKEVRRTIRPTVCLRPELLDQMGELTKVRDSLIVQGIGSNDEDGKSRQPGARYGAVGELDEVNEQITTLEDQIAASSVNIVFKALTSSRSAELLAKYREENTPANEQHLELMLLSFERFERHGEKVDGTVDDLNGLTTIMSAGEIRDLGEQLVTLTLGGPDIPFSVKQSLRRRR